MYDCHLKSTGRCDYTWQVELLRVDMNAFKVQCVTKIYRIH